MLKHIFLLILVMIFVSLGCVSMVFGLLSASFIFTVIGVICFATALLIWNYNELNNSNYY
jgi:membrane-bound ClpP family serine protease